MELPKDGPSGRWIPRTVAPAVADPLSNRRISSGHRLTDHLQPETLFMVYETPGKMSIVEPLIDPIPALQKVLLEPSHRLRLHWLQVVMPQQVQQSVDDVEMGLLQRAEMMLWRLADGSFGRNHDLPIELARIALFERKSDDVGDAGIVHELLMKAGDLFIFNEAEAHSSPMILVLENKMNQLDDPIMIQFDRSLEIFDLHLDPGWHCRGHQRRVATGESGELESLDSSAGVLIDSSSPGYLTRPW